MTVKVLNPSAVTVVVDGEEHEAVTDAPTVAGVLERMGIQLGRHDRVTPASDAQVKPGLRITVERVRVERRRRSETIEHDTVRRRTAQLTVGQEREVQSGRDGTARVTERVTYVDGDAVEVTVLRRRVVTPPRTRIVEVGTAAPPRPSSPSPSRSREPEPEPAPEQEQPAPRETEPSTQSQYGEASYYYHPEEGMTAAHRTLPMGTVVTVTNRANGKSVKVTINDRGPYIDGRIIDLNEPAFTQIAAKSTGVIDVKITW